VKECRTATVPGNLAGKPTYQLSSRLAPLRSSQDAKESFFSDRADADASQVPSPAWRVTRSPPASPSSSRRATFGGKVLALPPAPKSWLEARVSQNDVVEYASHLGTWKVIAPVNGSKADICRNGSFDTRIVTVPLESLRVLRHAGSPGYSY
jgi:hypothetical protein